MRGKIFLATCLALTVTAADARRFGDPLTARPISATEFEVIHERFTTNRDVWCAAGEFAREQLGLGRARLYLTAGKSPATTVPGQESYKFTTEAIPEAFQSYSIIINRVGANLSVAAARNACYQPYELDRTRG